MPKRKRKFNAVSGMFDILPSEYPLWLKIEEVVSSIANFYGFSKITTPILEEEELFVKGTGQDTEIVEKQMYSFKTKGGKRVVLRPEFTPSIVRAYIQNGMESLPKPVKLWSFGPVFRYERPQKGRYRQFWQFNFEIFGDKSPIQDVLLIQIFSDILRDLSLSKWIVEVNSIGCKECRSYYLRQLKNYYKNRLREICPECEKRLKKNPLRLLDCKEEKCQRVKKFAPQIVNSLCEDCHQYLKRVLEILDTIQIPYVLNPYLVRGLDYYTKTVFEFVPQDKKEGQSALIGGGRYDYLINQMGGKDTPAIGGAGGVERIIEEIREQKINILAKRVERFEKKPKMFLAQLGELAKEKSLTLLEEFRKNKIIIGENVGKDNLKVQLEQAAKLGVKYTLILGQREALEDTVIIRNMETGIQEIVFIKDIVKEIKKKVK
ncbi:MAG: histidine--tRNA ligase [Parcubacteria group bacterium CG_4_9_14_0_2_um_filter_35_11]|nr:MAG: histidine--tRNA ligase [Parcubacteria group bacterium CG_4_9_14_0_2_um_filter_35_11]